MLENAATGDARHIPARIAKLEAGLRMRPNLGDYDAVRTAFSWESVVDEFVFVVGPPLAALTAEAAGAPQAVALAAGDVHPGGGRMQAELVAGFDADLGAVEGGLGRH